MSGGSVESENRNITKKWEEELVHVTPSGFINWGFWMKNVACHISKQRILQPSSHKSLQQPLTVHPEGIQDEEKQDTGPR